jgi:predicted secreted Zn-dependent protease
LEHEQRHFDLCEIGARLLRDQIVGLRPSVKGNSDDDIRNQIQQIMNPLVSSFIDDVKRQQDRYDRESNHSRNRRAQQEWNARIQYDLDRLAPISSR